MNKNLSVILCTYNEAKIINKTIDEIFFYNPGVKLSLLMTIQQMRLKKLLKKKILQILNL